MGRIVHMQTTMTKKIGRKHNPLVQQIFKFAFIFSLSIKQHSLNPYWFVFLELFNIIKNTR